MTEIASQREKRVQPRMLQETASYKAPDASGRVRTTQYAQHECKTPAQAGQSPKMAKDASARPKRVSLPMPPKTEPDGTRDASRRVNMTLNNPEGCIEPAEGKRFARTSVDASPAAKDVPPAYKRVQRDGLPS